MLVTFPLDHVVLSLAEESVLWTEESAELKQLAAQFFESLRCMFQLRRNGGRMQQCADPRAAQFRRPKVLEMVQWKLNAHTRQGSNTHAKFSRGGSSAPRSMLLMAAAPRLFSIVRGAADPPLQSTETNKNCD